MEPKKAAYQCVLDFIFCNTEDEDFPKDIISFLDREEIKKECGEFISSEGERATVWEPFEYRSAGDLVDIIESFMYNFNARLEEQ